jgi:hypothetical protein
MRKQTREQLLHPEILVKRRRPLAQEKSRRKLQRRPRFQYHNPGWAIIKCRRHYQLMITEQETAAMV